MYLRRSISQPHQAAVVLNGSFLHKLRFGNCPNGFRGFLQAQARVGGRAVLGEPCVGVEPRDVARRRVGDRNLGGHHQRRRTHARHASAGACIGSVARPLARVARPGPPALAGRCIGPAHVSGWTLMLALTSMQLVAGADRRQAAARHAVGMPMRVRDAVGCARPGEGSRNVAAWLAFHAMVVTHRIPPQAAVYILCDEHAVYVGWTGSVHAAAGSRRLGLPDNRMRQHERDIAGHRKSAQTFARTPPGMFCTFIAAVGTPVATCVARYRAGTPPWRRLADGVQRSPSGYGSGWRREIPPGPRHGRCATCGTAHGGSDPPARRSGADGARDRRPDARPWSRTPR